MLFAPKMNEENHVGMKLLKRYLIEFNEEIILSIILSSYINYHKQMVFNAYDISNTKYLQRR